MKEEANHTVGRTVRTRLRLNRKVSVIMVCFLISTIFWLLLALSNEYNTSLTFPVRYHNLPGKKVVLNELPAEITVHIRTSGFKILSYQFSSSRKAIDVDVAGKLASGRDQLMDLITFPTKSFSPDFTRQLGGDVNIVGFIPDSIFLNFSDRVTKLVPVRPNFRLAFEKQYDTVGSIHMNPAVVEVSGPPELLNKIETLQTRSVKFDALRANTDVEVGFEENKLLTIKPEKVKAMIPVEKFTEGQATVRVYATNVNPGFSLKTFPDRILIRYQVPLSRFNDVNDQLFEARVDGSDVDSRHPDKLKVKLIAAPDFIRSVILEPEKVDYILRKE